MGGVGWERLQESCRVLGGRSAVLRHPDDTVQLEPMISVDCLHWNGIHQPGSDYHRSLRFSYHFVSVSAELLI